MLVLIVILVLLLIVAAWVAVTYNRLIALRLGCETSWSQIDVALKLRHDLIPVLTEAVAGYAGHERETLREVTEARTAAVAAGGEQPGTRGAAEGLLGSKLGRALILAEDYPDLKATANFSALQRDLADVEEKISITRRVYNDTVERYNTKIGVFPPVLIANAFSFAPREFFEAPAGAEIAPTIDVGGSS